jgi:hypothetical protein
MGIIRGLPVKSSELLRFCTEVGKKLFFKYLTNQEVKHLQTTSGLSKNTDLIL